MRKGFSALVVGALVVALSVGVAASVAGPGRSNVVTAHDRSSGANGKALGQGAGDAAQPAGAPNPKQDGSVAAGPGAPALSATPTAVKTPDARPADSARNPFGLVIVRFAKGSSAKQMQDAVANAGGVVTTDLTKLQALAVAPVAKDVVSRLRATKGVVSVFSDKVVQGYEPDAAGDGGTTGSNEPASGSGAAGPPDPWHNAPSFLGETNPEGILQWDDNRMNVPAAWASSKGRGVKVAVLDSGVQGSHKELLPNYDNQNSTNTIPCSLLNRQYGSATVREYGLKDCSSEDTDGHGTWVASRIAGAANGFASNGVAPEASVMGVKVLATGFGGFTSWIVAGMVHACDADADLINMSLGGFDDAFDASNPFSPDEQADVLLWKAAVDYCTARGTTILASAGNDHVRINRENRVIDGIALNGLGVVDAAAGGISSVLPGTATLEKYVNDLRGMVEVPAGIPGVIMVGATNNAIGGTAATAGLSANATALVWPATFAGAEDQLTYYSNYGSRIDITAPGGARKFNIPRYDVGNLDILYGGWGTLGALDPSGEICTDPALASILTFTCFKVNGAGFGWLQGTSMSSPNATGVAALTLAAHPSLKGSPAALLSHLQATARRDMTNHMGPNDPTNKLPSAAGVACPTGWCHVDLDSSIGFADAYGAGIVDAGNAIRP